MFVMIVGCGRVGSASRKEDALRGPRGVTSSTQDPEAIAHLEKGSDAAGGAGRLVHGGTALESDALIESGIDRGRAFVASTDGDNTNLVIAQIARAASR